MVDHVCMTKEDQFACEKFAMEVYDLVGKVQSPDLRKFSDTDMDIRYVQVCCPFVTTCESFGVAQEETSRHEITKKTQKVNKN